MQVKLAEPVLAVGNIEDWLKKMVAGMQDTIKKIIRKSWEEVNALPVEKFIFSYPAQVSTNLDCFLKLMAYCRTKYSGNQGKAPMTMTHVAFEKSRSVLRSQISAARR